MEKHLNYVVVCLCGFLCGVVITMTFQSEARKVKYIVIKESQIERL